MMKHVCIITTKHKIKAISVALATVIALSAKGPKIMKAAREMLAIKLTPPTFTISRLTFVKRWIAVEIVISGALFAISIWYLSNEDWYSTILFASTSAAVNVASRLARKIRMVMLKPNVK
ncbi:hypothetical protein SCD_n02612 [Sulfuricella denitrificans skB26]|uniref:Uncharacterized protein n=1 Tax=Sulfuricella denitrificans (strain DSM 22764 / NBRC 105220 / skB26) TaxID=1163617 RepID=S6ADF0_SULDS|nr:hypothetical protein SCD_n02612 [Sulfuricella denitrificans skB26]